MDWWIVIGGGVAALIVVFLAFSMDRHVFKRRTQILEAAPDQPLLKDHGKVTYLMAEQARQPVHHADDGSLKSSASISSRIAEVSPLMNGYASPDFVTDPESGRAVLSQPLVIVTEAVTQMADVVPMIEKAQDEAKPIVVVAGRITDEVVTTLGVNCVSNRLKSLIVISDDPEGFAQKLGVEVVSHTDLVAGFLPPEVFGSCSLWVSDSTQTWIL
ncbi:MAG: hypothetical protein LBG99_05785 [Propionibacteriaceae bacterium]|nr:hypothetical protein [Propionibacteriaceae bacterium]